MNVSHLAIIADTVCCGAMLLIGVGVWRTLRTVYGARLPWERGGIWRR